MVAGAPSFSEVAGRIFRALDGRIWVGHNIDAFDVPRLKENFASVGMRPPRPAGVIDTLTLLRGTLGNRAGNLKMVTLGSYFGEGEEEHRALADARMTLNVLRSAGAVLFLEEAEPEVMWGMPPAQRSTGEKRTKRQQEAASVPVPATLFFGKPNSSDEHLSSSIGPSFSVNDLLQNVSKLDLGCESRSSDAVVEPTLDAASAAEARPKKTATSGSGGLTEDQRAKIEFNRRRAMELRAQKSAAAPHLPAPRKRMLTPTHKESTPRYEYGTISGAGIVWSDD